MLSRNLLIAILGAIVLIIWSMSMSNSKPNSKPKSKPDSKPESKTNFEPQAYNDIKMSNQGVFSEPPDRRDLWAQDE